MHSIKKIKRVTVNVMQVYDSFLIEHHITSLTKDFFKLLQNTLKNGFLKHQYILGLH